MTLCDLLHKVTWEEVRPYIEQHLAECPGMKLSDYERMFERLRRMAPERWVVPGLFRFYISPDTPYSREWKDIAHDTISSNNGEISICPMPNGLPIASGRCHERRSNGRSLNRCIVFGTKINHSFYYGLDGFSRITG